MNKMFTLAVMLATIANMQSATQNSNSPQVTKRVWYAQHGVDSIESMSEFDFLKTQSILLVHFYYKNSNDRDQHYRETSELFSGLEKDIADVVIFGKVNLQRSHLAPLAQTYTITRTPTILLLKEGKEVDRLTGLITASDIRTMVKKHCGDLIKKYREWQKKRELELYEFRRRNPPPYYHWGYGPWGYPYGPYWRGWGWGFGLGWRGGGWRGGCW